MGWIRKLTDWWCLAKKKQVTCHSKFGKALPYVISEVQRSGLQGSYVLRCLEGTGKGWGRIESEEAMTDGETFRETGGNVEWQWRFVHGRQGGRFPLIQLPSSQRQTLS